MLGDLLIALPLGLLAAIACATAATAEPAYRQRLEWGLLAVMLGLVAAAQFSYAFDGYGADLWMYLTIVERVAEGDWLFDREPFWLEPPGAPFHSVQWIALGLLKRAIGLSSYAGVRLAGFATIVALSLAAWLLSSAVFTSQRLRCLGLLTFWASLQPGWAELALNRNLALAFVLIATWKSLRFRGSFADAALLTASITLAFYVHLFGGVLALAAGLLATAARVWQREPVHPRALAAAVFAALVLASPWLLLGSPEPGRSIAPEHLWGPGQFELAGLRAFHPARLIHTTSPALLLLAPLGGLALARPGLLPAARSLAWMGPAAVALLLFTPLYHAATALFGGWMLPRLVFLAFLWIPAAAGLGALGGLARLPVARTAMAVAVGLVFWLGGARVTRDFRHPELYNPVAAEARREARALRTTLQGHKYLSAPHLAYGLAPHSLGLPLAVPSGHGSALHPFSERARHAFQILRTTSRGCWGAFARRYPDLEFLVTPAEGAAVEQEIWNQDVAPATPAAVRARLAEWGVLRPVFEGRYFVVDALHTEGLSAIAARCES